MGMKYNPHTGQIESAPLVDVPGLANQILDRQGVQDVDGIVKANYPTAVQIPVKSPEGRVGYVPTSEVKKALQAGFEVLDKEQFKEASLEQKYGDSPIAAGALGVARGASFGLTDVAARALGYNDAVRELMKRNPTASTAGEIVGAVGTAFLPVGAGALIARGATQAAARISTGAVSRVIAAGAIEGAAQGVAQTITEQSLGSERDVAESLVANVGMGTLLGGTFSGVFHGVGLGVKKASNKIAHNLAKGDDAINKIDEFITGEGRIKAEDIEEIRQAAGRLGVTPTPGMESGSPTYRYLEGSLSKSPSYWGKKVYSKIDDAYSTMTKEAEDLLEDTTGRTVLELGDEIKTRISLEVQHRKDPVQMLYKKFERESELIPVAENNAKGTIAALKRLVRNEPKDSDALKAVNSIVEELSDTTDMSVAKLQAIISNNGSKSRSLQVAQNQYPAMIIDRAVQSLKRLEERSIVRAAVEQAGHAGRGKALAKELIDERKAARAGWRELMEFIGEVGKDAKLGKIKSTKTLLDRLDDVPSEKLVDNLFNLKDIRKMERIQNKFPDIFEDIINFKKAQLFQSATTYNEALNKPALNLKKLIKNYESMSDEAKIIMFGTEGKQRLKDIAKVLRTMPPDPNPSRTAIEQMFQDIISPKQWISEGMRYGLYKGLPILQQTAQKNSTRINKAVDTFFNMSVNQPATRAATISALNSIAPDYKERLSKLSELNSNQMYVMEKMADDVKGLSQIDPQLQYAVLNQGWKAMQFLQAKAPKKMQPAALLDTDSNDDYSDFDLAKFSRYVRAVDNPISVLEEVQMGLISDEGVEALREIYPSLYNNIKQRVVEKAEKNKKNLTYQQKLNITKLLGMPATQSADPLFIYKMQQTEMPVEGQQRQGVRIKSDDLGISQRAQTQAQRITMR